MNITIRFLRLNFLIALANLVVFFNGCEQPRMVSPQWEILNSGSRASLRGVSAVDANIIWASGSEGTVLRSADGGQHWEHLLVPDADTLDFRDIEAFDRNTAIIMSAGNGEQSRLYKTEDGGQHWRLLYTNAYPEGFYNGMAFWNARQGIVYSDAVNKRFLVLLTEDGGERWQEVGRESLPESLPGEHAYAASGTGIATAGVGHAWFASGGAAARVFKTTDFGASWRAVRTPVISNSETAGIFSLAFWNEKRGTASGGDYKHRQDHYDNIALTEDGGETWYLAENFPLGLRSATLYLTDHLLFSVGSHGADYSVDGGHHWIAISETGYYAASHAEKTVWAVGADGRMGRLSF